MSWCEVQWFDSSVLHHLFKSSLMLRFCNQVELKGTSSSPSVVPRRVAASGNFAMQIFKAHYTPAE
jgi:hypothetical protein